MKKSDEITLAKKAHYAENHEHKKGCKKMRYDTDIVFKISQGLSISINRAYKKLGIKKTKSNEEILGCKFSESHSYLSLYGADWGCWGVDSSKGGKGFDIDHVVPISSATNETELLTVLHFTNLQILNSYENRFVKRNKLNYQPIK